MKLPDPLQETIIWFLLAEIFLIVERLHSIKSLIDFSSSSVNFLGQRRHRNHIVPKENLYKNLSTLIV